MAKKEPSEKELRKQAKLKAREEKEKRLEWKKSAREKREALQKKKEFKPKEAEGKPEKQGPIAFLFMIIIGAVIGYVFASLIDRDLIRWTVSGAIIFFIVWWFVVRGK